MDLEDGSKDTVHPEVRAHINSLVSAVCSARPSSLLSQSISSVSHANPPSDAVEYSLADPVLKTMADTGSATMRSRFYAI